MKRKLKLENRGVRANCSHCQFGGVVDNYMCSCSNGKVNNGFKRSVGYRKCAEFKLDTQKYDALIYA